MSQIVVERAKCGKCGVDVRENTLFCYNCGERVGPPKNDPAEETERSVEELERTIKIEPPPADTTLSKAAAERRKSRANRKRGMEFVWEPVEEETNRYLVLFTLLITVFAMLVVTIALYWK